MSLLVASSRRGAGWVLMIASGFAGMAYEIIWTQQSSVWLGHEAAAVLAVVTAFFGGLALGSVILGGRIEQSASPVRWYACCEWMIALWSLALAFCMSPFSGWLMRAIGAEPEPAWQWSAAFLGTFVLFLPATAAMGATLPAMNRITRESVDDGRTIAALYACNTGGAVLGVLATAFWLIPTVGLARAALVCTALNGACGSLAWAVLPNARAGSVERAPTQNARPPSMALERLALTRLAFTGLFGVGYEVVVMRVLSQVTEGTVYTLALLLAVYLAGTAAGAAVYQRWLRGLQHRKGLADALLATVACACLVGTSCLAAANAVKAWIDQALGAGLGAALLGEAALAIVAFAPATIAMGALFSELSAGANAAGVGFGRALGVNMWGAAAAPIVCGVVAVPLMGPKLTLIALAVAYLALTERSFWRRPQAWVPAGGALALAALTPPLRFVEVPHDGRLVSYEEGVTAAVSVVHDRAGVARLRINNRQQEGSSASARVDSRQAWLPLLLHPAPQRALFLGLGTGVTAFSAAQDRGLQVDAVELLPEVIAASVHFLPVNAGESPLHVIAGDARRYVRASDRAYDVIVSDNFHPARSGSAALYTVEHFQAVRSRLTPTGLFCQWLPLHQLDVDTLRSIVQSFVAVYPQSWAMIASNSLETPVVGLLARAERNGIDWQQVRQRVAHAALTDRLRAIGLEDELAVLGSFVAGPAALRRFAGDAVVNSDDHPIVAYTAPRITYAPESSPRDRFIALLHELSIAPQELLVSDGDGNFASRLSGYWRARDRFIEAGRDVSPSTRVTEMLAQVREPLLSVLQVSPDFRPAYDPLLAMATALAQSDAIAGRALLAELARLQPERPEAAKMLARIDQGGNAR